MACCEAVAVSVRTAEKGDAVGRAKAALEDSSWAAGRRSWREREWINTILKDDEIPLNCSREEGGG